MSIPTQVAGPITADERIEIVDILRGFALFGILVVNMAFFALPVYHVVVDVPWGSGPADTAASFLIRFLAEGKFYVLFSFLFGWGMAIQLARAEARGVNPVPVYRRRILILLLIGLVHALLIWHGDILVVYALLGFVLLAFRKRADKTILIWAGVFLILPLVWTTAMVGLVEMGRIFAPEDVEQAFAAAHEQYSAAYEESMQIFSTGTFGEILRQRLSEYGFALFGGFLFNGMALHVLAMFLIGLYVGRKGYLARTGEFNRQFRRTMIVGLAVGLIANSIYAANYNVMRSIEASFGSLGIVTVFMLGAPLLTLGYVSALVVLSSDDRRRRRIGAVLAPVGRTALTNYLLQSIICTLIFYSYGLGMFGQLGPAVGLALAVAIFALQVFASRWWLERYRFGPAEWVWRSLTYGRRQPMRRDPVAA